MGVLAARFLPMPSEVPVEPSMVPVEEPTTTVSTESGVTESEMMLPVQEKTPAPTPSATPSALMNLKWNMMTVRSPVSFFNSYRIYYPTTWTVKEYKNTSKANDAGSSTLTLTREKTSIDIIQNNQLAPECDYSGNHEAVGVGNLGFAKDYKEVFKDNRINWRWALSSNISVPEYIVCEAKISGNFTNSTSIGFIKFSSEGVTSETLDEVNFILEKIVILK